jgi:hypothetical protein
VTTAPCAINGVAAPNVASDEVPAMRNPRLSSIERPFPLIEEVSNVRGQTNSLTANVSARGYRDWLACVVNANMAAELSSKWIPA